MFFSDVYVSFCFLTNCPNIFQVSTNVTIGRIIKITNTFSGGSKGGEKDTPPGDPNSFNFMQFFGKIWQNRMLAPPESWRPLLGEILDPPLTLNVNISINTHTMTDMFKWFILSFAI